MALKVIHDWTVVYGMLKGIKNNTKGPKEGDNCTAS